MYIQPELQERVKLLFDSRQQHMGDHLDIKFTSIKKDEIRATMPVDERTIQPFGILHGGASVVLAETLASVGAWLNLKGTEQTSVGIEINAYHIRYDKKWLKVQRVASHISIGRKLYVWEI